IGIWNESCASSWYDPRAQIGPSRARVCLRVRCSSVFPRTFERTGRRPQHRVPAGRGGGVSRREPRGGKSCVLAPRFRGNNSIALKEVRESLYWLRVIQRCDLVPRAEVHPLLNEADELTAMLTAAMRRLNPQGSAGAAGNDESGVRPA